MKCFFTLKVRCNCIVEMNQWQCSFSVDDASSGKSMKMCCHVSAVADSSLVNASVDNFYCFHELRDLIFLLCSWHGCKMRQKFENLFVCHGHCLNGLLKGSPFRATACLPLVTSRLWRFVPLLVVMWAAQASFSISMMRYIWSMRFLPFGLVEYLETGWCHHQTSWTFASAHQAAGSAWLCSDGWILWRESRLSSVSCLITVLIYRSNSQLRKCYLFSVQCPLLTSVTLWIAGQSYAEF